MYNQYEELAAKTKPRKNCKEKDNNAQKNILFTLKKAFDDDVGLILLESDKEQLSPDDYDYLAATPHDDDKDELLEYLMAQGKESSGEGYLSGVKNSV